MSTYFKGVSFAYREDRPRFRRDSTVHDQESAMWEAWGRQAGMAYAC